HTPLDGGLRMTGVPTGSVYRPKIGDDGTVVFSTSGTLHVSNFNLNKDTAVPGFAHVGNLPSISDGKDPWVAFTAHSATLGDGVFAAQASSPDKWYKIVGVG